MEPLVSADQPNESRILAQIDKVAQARAELEKANARYLLALRNKLTPDQWKQVQAFRANHGPHEGREFEHSERDGRGPGGQHHGPMMPPPPLPPPPQGADSGAPPAPPETPAAGAGDEQ